MTQCGKPICSICYEDFKPIIEDLQSISVCGHVFHELCIQQWLEYCPAGKRPTCPVCKQAFTSNSLVRLYFQSAGVPVDASLPLSPFHNAPSDAEVELLKEDAMKLQGKLSVISSAFENQNKRVEELTNEVARWKGKSSEEEAAKDTVRQERDRIALLLRQKQDELSAISAECARLRERCLALAKELAAIKLATDINLEEEDVTKFALVGNEGRLADALDVLKKSLVLRNRSYKELMAQCNLLGRSESRALKKLEKAEEKIKKLKARLQEFAKALEERENGILRNLKSSKIETMGVLGPDLLFMNTCSINVKNKECRPISRSDELALPSISFMVNIDKNLEPVSLREGNDNAGDSVPMSNAHFSFDSNASGCSTLEPLRTGTFHDDSVANHLAGLNQAAPSACQQASNLQNAFGDKYLESRSGTSDIITDLLATEKDLGNSENLVSVPEVVCIDDEFEKEPSHPPSNIGTLAHEDCAISGFSNGLFGSKESNRRPGKWCRRGMPPISLAGTSTPTGNLIAVGADGRGGKIKVLRTLDQNPDKSQELPAKRIKGEAKQATSSKGCLQIEHFFGKQRH